MIEGLKTKNKVGVGEREDAGPREGHVALGVHVLGLKLGHLRRCRQASSDALGHETLGHR